MPINREALSWWVKEENRSCFQGISIFIHCADERKKVRGTLLIFHLKSLREGSSTGAHNKDRLPGPGRWRGWEEVPPQWRHSPDLAEMLACRQHRIAKAQESDWHWCRLPMLPSGTVQSCRWFHPIPFFNNLGPTYYDKFPLGYMTVRN